MSITSKGEAGRGSPDLNFCETSRFAVKFFPATKQIPQTRLAHERDFCLQENPAQRSWTGFFNTAELRRALIQHPHSESHVAVKLEPSELSPEGTDSSAPVLPLTMIDSNTLEPNALITPDTEVESAPLVPLTPV